MKEDVVKKVIEKTIAYDLLGCDTNGQWYDTIKNGGKPIKTPKLFSKKNEKNCRREKR